MIQKSNVSLTALQFDPFVLQLFYLWLLYFKLKQHLILCHGSYSVSIDNYVVVWWCVVVCSCDYNFDVTCGYCYDCRSNVIWICSCCCNSNVSLVWSCWTSWVLCFSFYIYSPISMAAYAYSRELTSCTIDFIGFKIYFNAHVNHH